ncbi:hypothetical protein [Streptomyces sp. NPDC048584]|uniref:hypothetical protein n=1 Tax=Streptomyces sp. NPDC048584 TaxID=3365573 RepID=UPI00371A50BF
MSGLDEFQRTSVYGRDDGASGLAKVWDDLLGRPPERESWRITPVIGQRLEQLMQRIGIGHSTAHLRFGDDWKLQPRALDAGPGWEDRLAVGTTGWCRRAAGSVSTRPGRPPQMGGPREPPGDVERA